VLFTKREKVELDTTAHKSIPWEGLEELYFAPLPAASDLLHVKKSAKEMKRE